MFRLLPRDRGQVVSTGAIVEATYDIPGERMDWLAQSSPTPGANLDAIFLTAFATLLARLTGQDSVTLRCGSQNRSLLTLTFTAEMSFRSLFAASLDPQASSPDRPCSVEFVSSDSAAILPDLPGQVLRMSVRASNTEGRVSLVSSTGLWEEPVLHLWLRYFDRLVAAAVASPDHSWKTLPLLEPGDARQFYHAFNQTGSPLPLDSFVHDLVARNAAMTPDAIAVESEWRPLTYRQLLAKSKAVAHHLQQLGAGPNRAVAVCLERSVDLPVALLAVLGSGAFYVPLDPQEAPQRLTTILEECGAAAIIADRSMVALKHSASAPVVYLDDLPDYPDAQYVSSSSLTSNHPAYTIYTSGTTGKPKGVTISHDSLANLLHSFLQKPGFTSSDRMLAVSPISFDIATLDMFLPLLAGGTVVIADRLVASDPFRLAAMLKNFEITVLQATPATWRLLQSSGWEGRPALKMISGGEALPRDLANRLLTLGAELWNCYGPTETTIYSGIVRIQTEDGIVPIGPPIANTTFYVLDDTGRLLPPGVPGELYIGGAGVASGYLNQPQLTRQRFVPDPYSEAANARMFRSGDLVRLVNGNELEFFGRLDHQVKLRGYRIELGEIESVMRTFPGIDNAVAGLRKDTSGEPHLVAYFTVSQEMPDLLLLRDYLSQRLPSYMLPGHFVLMDAMPLTNSGKIDRRALLASDSGTALPAHQQAEAVKPNTELEQKLLPIFQEVLNTTEFGVTDSFFAYGGYSLLTVKLFTRINRRLAINLPISLLFDAPTVRALAEIIERPQACPPSCPSAPMAGSRLCL